MVIHGSLGQREVLSLWLPLLLLLLLLLQIPTDFCVEVTVSDENPSSNRCLTQEEMDDFLEKEIFNNQSPKRKRDEEMIEPSKRIRCEEINQSPKRKRDEEMIEPSKRIRCEEIFNNQPMKRKRDKQTQTDYQSNQVCFKVLYQFLNKYNKTT